ncbi:hypothetical protein PISMIDRAFT_436714 [Pisolithus microcarpus 441]|uniref:Uncharacterized protein n=1 Tax=Pisolithus microcarpus 441 TaxID=765257 RepID=A0A0C9YFS1_9AGAM|nr:hypothetical protein PISMIDRAFT_436714 [Pisolithus microcarpus 441]
MHQPTGTTQFDKSANKQRKDVAIKFFSDVFGLKYLRNYIGDITFFARFPSMMETSTVSDVPSASATEEDGLLARLSKLPCASSMMRYIPFRGIWQFANAEPDSRLETVLPLLRRRCQTVFAQSDVPRWYAHESRRVEGEIKSISQTLGADLYAHIRIAFYNAYHEQKSSTEAKHRALRAKLDATIDEGESRALEEDITGKILWLFWCGICVEADELLPKVVDYIRRAGSARGLDRMSRLTPAAQLSDDQSHLQRIMYDAGANTSKYQLWLDARAREQAKWPRTDRGTSTIDDQGTTPSTSHQSPSSSIIHTTSVAVLPQTSTQKGKLSESHGTGAGADDELANRSTRRLRRQAWYGGDGWVSRLIVISYPAALVFVIRALSIQ